VPRRPVRWRIELPVFSSRRVRASGGTGAHNRRAAPASRIVSAISGLDRFRRSDTKTTRTEHRPPHILPAGFDGNPPRRSSQQVKLPKRSDEGSELRRCLERAPPFRSALLRRTVQLSRTPVGRSHSPRVVLTTSGQCSAGDPRATREKPASSAHEIEPLAWQCACSTVRSSFAK
jgi:hypothetical protein